MATIKNKFPAEFWKDYCFKQSVLFLHQLDRKGFKTEELMLKLQTLLNRPAHAKTTPHDKPH